MSMRNQQVITGLPFSVKPIQDITDTLPRKTTGEWEPDRTPNQITHISVHHSAVEGGTIQGYAKTHVYTNGWRQIGYHMVIKGDQIYQTNDLLTFSYHTSSNNGYTVSVSVSGDLSKRALTTDERNCLYATILTYMALFNIPVENVLGHNEYPNNNTSCPCIDMNQVRSDIKTMQMKIQRVSSLEAQLERGFSVANQALFMYNKSKEENGDGAWARHWLDEVHSIMKEKGLL